jgi:lactoylglutathione lyase
VTKFCLDVFQAVAERCGPIDVVMLYVGAARTAPLYGYTTLTGDEAAQVELTHNWDPEEYSGRRNFGHLAYAVDNIYDTCTRLMSHGVIINRPPRDGRMAFVRSPDQVSIELLQKGAALAPAAPWTTMPNVGQW